MRSYVKKPVVINALQWTGNNKTEMLKFCPDCYLKFEIGVVDPVLKVKTLEGEMTAGKTDYIIRGIKGEYYPCKKEIFDMTYDEVKE